MVKDIAHSTTSTWARWLWATGAGPTRSVPAWGGLLPPGRYGDRRGVRTSEPPHVLKTASAGFCVMQDSPAGFGYYDQRQRGLWLGRAA